MKNSMDEQLLCLFNITSHVEFPICVGDFRMKDDPHELRWTVVREVIAAGMNEKVSEGRGSSIQSPTKRFSWIPIIWSVIGVQVPSPPLSHSPQSITSLTPYQVCAINPGSAQAGASFQNPSRFQTHTQPLHTVLHRALFSQDSGRAEQFTPQGP